MRIWSAVVPSSAAIFVLMPSTFTALAAPAFVSPVAMATMAADFVSAMNRMPSGPKVIGPADLRVTLPSVMPEVEVAAEATPASRARPSDAARREGVFIGFD